MRCYGEGRSRAQLEALMQAGRSLVQGAAGPSLPEG
ncbi:MAG: hypothetical protein ACE5JD_10515 [Candidatus Methylomirabilia bacterium]